MEADQYARMAATEDHMWWYRGLHAWLIDRLQALSLDEGASVLDCGAGTGGFSRKLTERFPDIFVVGVDINAEAVRFYSTRARRPVVRGSVNELAFGDGSFDIIFCADVLYHNAVNETAAIHELFRCLKPGGSLLLNLPAYNWMQSSHDQHIHTARRYTARGATKVMQSAGFHIREANYRNSFLFPVMAAWRLTFGRFSATSDVDDFPVWQEFLFSRVIGLENIVARGGVRFPFGGSVYIHAIKPQKTRD